MSKLYRTWPILIDNCFLGEWLIASTLFCRLYLLILNTLFVVSMQRYNDFYNIQNISRILNHIGICDKRQALRYICIVLQYLSCQFVCSIMLDLEATETLTFSKAK